MNDTPKGDTAADAKAWVDENKVLVEEVYQRFLADGEWPDVPSLQRRFDRLGSAIEVQKAVDAKPRVAWEARPLHAERLTLQIRHLMWLDKARPLVAVCVQAVQRAVQSYLSDDDPPVVTSEELLTSYRFDLHAAVYEVLTTFEHPSPFGGSTKNETSWTIQVDPRFARRFRGVETAADFVAKQDEIRAEWSQLYMGLAPPVTTDARAGAVSPDETVATADPVLFLSWARDTSKRVARALVPILESRLVGVDVFFTPSSLEPGDDPSRRIFDEGLLGASALVVVLTQEGAGSAFAIWETAAAWGRGKLVIPLFVDIEPDSVPGPLTSKVQGVHLRDRADVDRAVERLASNFAVAGVSLLTDEEYGSPEAAAREEAPRGSDRSAGAVTTEDQALAQGPFLVVTTSSYTKAPDGWSRDIEIENLGTGAAVQCGVVCFGDFDSWGFERGFNLGPGAVKATVVRSTQAGPVPDRLFDESPGVRLAGDLVGRFAVVCLDILGTCWRFIEGIPTEHWRRNDPVAPAWVRSRFFGWPSAGAS